MTGKMEGKRKGEKKGGRDLKGQEAQLKQGLADRTAKAAVSVAI